MRAPPTRGDFLFATLVLTLLIETATLVARFGVGVSAVEFNRTAPWILQLHHMFWAIPVLGLAAACRRYPWPRMLLLSLAVALVASDLLHHFVVLPLLVGNTGWHWP